MPFVTSSSRENSHLAHWSFGLCVSYLASRLDTGERGFSHLSISRRLLEKKENRKKKNNTKEKTKRRSSSKINDVYVRFTEEVKVFGNGIRKQKKSVGNKKK